MAKNTEDHLSKLPEKLSPSRLQDFNTCPKMFYYKTILGLPTPPSVATIKGNLAHEAFERVFDHPPHERTPEVAISYIRPAFDKMFYPSEEYLAGLTDKLRERAIQDAASSALILPPESAEAEEVLEETASLVTKWFSMERVTNFDPTVVPLPTGEEVDGREIYLSAEVGGVPLHGYVDRLDSWASADKPRAWSISDYKGLALDTPLPTPNGWTTMGEVKVGDRLVSSTGEPTTVVGKSEVRNIDCFKLSVAPYGSVVCDSEHKWQVVVEKAGVVSDMVLSANDLAILVLDDAITVSLPAGMWIDGRAVPSRKVVSVKPVPSVPTACVSVDAPDSLHYAGVDRLLTHNTGKLPQPRYQDKYWLQLKIYALLMKEIYGVDVSVLRLVFVATGDREKGILSLPLDDKALDLASKQVSAMWADIRTSARKMEWKTKKGPLCNWCHFQPVCPAWNPEFEQAKD